MPLPRSMILDGITDATLVASLQSIRKVCGEIASEAPAIIPFYTDHTIQHMDNLALVADLVLTSEEIKRLTQAERFMLAASFYLHDIGMTIPVLEGVRQKHFSDLDLSGPTNDIQEKIRRKHHLLARVACCDPVLAGGEYIISDRDIRDKFAHTLAEICVSHGESIAALDNAIGAAGVLSFNEFGKADPGYIASVLRVVDYADITGVRASSTILQTRQAIPKESKKHWSAQAKIALPLRESNLLRYNSLGPLESMDAWWQFFDLARGLDTEVKGVKAYLSGRKDSDDRFSLEGIAAVDSPRSMARFIKTPAEAVPIDIQVRVPSVAKIVSLFGGPELYGDDRQAPIRELIQNARDAIELRKRLSPGEDFVPRITVSVTENDFEIRDNGMGMNQYIVENYLLGVAASYWGSNLAKEEGHGEPISHAGRFGVGFMSVFMLGTEVSITTRRPKSKPVHIELSGLDNRGVQKEVATENVGTTITVTLSNEAKGLPITKHPLEVLRSRAPMLSIPLVLATSTSNTVIEPCWWRKFDRGGLSTFLRKWYRVAVGGEGDNEPMPRSMRYTRRGFGVVDSAKLIDQADSWPNETPLANTQAGFLLFDGGRAGFLVCSHGLAVNFANMGLLSGMVDFGEQDISLSRAQLGGDEPPMSRFEKSDAGKELLPLLEAAVLAEALKLPGTGMISRYVALIDRCIRFFGPAFAEQMTAPWIPVLGRTGDLTHRSEKDVRESIAKANSAFIVIGASNPARIMTYLARVEKFRPGLDETIACTFYTFDIDYDTRKELTRDEGDPLTGTVAEVSSKIGTEIIISAAEHYLELAREVLVGANEVCTVFLDAEFAVISLTRSPD